MIDRVLILAEQEGLLARLVEASRSVPADRRQQFLAFMTLDSAPSHEVIHPGFPSGESRAFLGDLETLAAEQLLRIDRTDHHQIAIDVTPRGFAYYADMKLRSGQQFTEIEDTIMSYLDAEPFRERHPRAHAKWTQASERLWSSDSEHELTVIGHLCREAMQEFAAALVDRYRPEAVNPNIQAVVARIRAVLQMQRTELGSTSADLLDALVVYWGTASDLIQRQEHGGQRENRPLTWEDGRRVVFQTANAMFEIDRALQFLG